MAAKTCRGDHRGETDHLFTYRAVETFTWKAFAYEIGELVGGAHHHVEDIVPGR